jgi:hypothetical protein
VKKAGGDLDDVTPVASLTLARVSRVFKFGDKLVVFRSVPPADKVSRTGEYVEPATEAVVLDFSQPTKPRIAGRVTLPSQLMPQYRFWCGVDSFWGGYWFGDQNNFALTDSGLVFLTQVHSYDQRLRRGSWTSKLVTLDLQNADAPKVQSTDLASGDDATQPDVLGLVSDPVDRKGFYVNRRTKVGETKAADGSVFARYRTFAERRDPAAGQWAVTASINLPGPLVRTWAPAAGQRLFLAQDTYWTQEDRKDEKGAKVGVEIHGHVRLGLLQPVQVGGKPAAELLDLRYFYDQSPSSLLVDGARLYVAVQPDRFGYGYQEDVAFPASSGSAVAVSRGGLTATAPDWEKQSARLVIFDVSKKKLDVSYDKATRANNVSLMGIHAGKLFVNLEGDGILVVDASNAAQPRGIKFLRTLGWGSFIEFFGDDVYVATGHFGLDHLTLGEAASIPLE